MSQNVPKCPTGERYYASAPLEEHAPFSVRANGTNGRCVFMPLARTLNDGPFSSQFRFSQRVRQNEPF